MGIEWFPALVSIAFFAMVIVIVAIGSYTKQRNAQIHADVQNRLIERFGSAPEFVQFLQSDAGRRMMNGTSDLPRAIAHDRILVGVRRAVVLGFLGLGFLGMCISESVRNSGFIIAGSILLALGLGYAISAILSVKLSREWGLVPPKADPDDLTSGTSLTRNDS